jgi:hypothetical protein
VRAGAHKRPIAPLSMISGRQSAGRGPRQPCVGPTAAHHRARQRLRMSNFIRPALFAIGGRFREGRLHSGRG